MPVGSQAAVGESGRTESAGVLVWIAADAIEQAEALEPRLDLRPSGSADRQDEPEVESSCVLGADRIECSVPEGTWDATLYLQGFAPWFGWDVEIQGEQSTRLGPFRLVEGASVTGSIQLDEDDASRLERPDLVLERAFVGFQHDPREAQKLKRLDYQARPDDRNFFQFQGIREGSYSLKVRWPDLGDTVLAELEVDAGEAVFLDQPLAVELPEPVEVFVDPPVDGQGMPWQVRISRLVAKRQLESLDEGAVDEFGSWTSRPLPSGFYEVSITEGHNTWHEKIFEHPIESLLQVDLPFVRVVGELRMGDEPLAAELIFGSFHGAPRIWMNSDKDGKFSGALPRGGEWPLDVQLGPDDLRTVEPVEIDRADDPAELDLVLPANSVSGRVVRYGSPVDKAYIEIREQGSDAERLATAFADAEGNFLVRSIPPGPIAVSATDLTISSEWTLLNLEEDGEVENLRLELVAQRRVRGRVVSVQGDAVPGVEITGEAGDGHFMRRPVRTISSVDGTFELIVPEDRRQLDLILNSPAFGIKLVRQSLPEPDYESGSFDVELAPLALQRQKIAIKLPAEVESWWLTGGGASFRSSDMISFFLRMDQLTSTSTGLWLEGLEAAEYAFCKEPLNRCVGATASSRPEGRILEGTSAETSPTEGR